MNNCYSSNLDRHLHIGVLLISASVYEFTSSQDTEIELKDLTYTCANLVRLSEICSRIAPHDDTLQREERSISYILIRMEEQDLQSHVMVQHIPYTLICRFMHRKTLFFYSKGTFLYIFRTSLLIIHVNGHSNPKGSVFIKGRMIDLHYLMMVKIWVCAFEYRVWCFVRLRLG